MLTRPRIGSLPLLVLPFWFACSSDAPLGNTQRPIEVTPGLTSTAGTVGTTAPTGASGTGAASGTFAAPGGAGTPAPAGPSGIAGATSVGMPGTAGTGGLGRGGAPGFPGRQGGPAGAPGIAGASGMPAGAAGMVAAAGGAAPPVGGDMFAAEREACVAHINMYRATMMLAPLKRASAELELCSDEGAKQDADTGKAHGSAGKCRGLGGQNTCPGWPVRGGTLTSTMQKCLDQMWAEGEPPNGVQACIQDRTGCFLMHGHWINMSMSNFGTVACGFYKMANGSYWMNQNFGN